MARVTVELGVPRRLPLPSSLQEQEGAHVVLKPEWRVLLGGSVQLLPLGW